MIPFKIINIKERARKAIRYCIFCAILYPTISCNSSRNIISLEEKNQEWKIVKVDKNDEPSWRIYSRKLHDTTIYEYKIEGNIESPVTACLSAFKADILDLANGSKIEKKLTTYKLLHESEDSLLTYVINNEPFPLKDTEMCVRYKFFYNEDGNTGVKWNDAWDECTIQPSKKLKRVEMFRGSWNFSSNSNNSSKAINSIQFDPKKIPQWLWNSMVIKFLVEGLENIREMTSE